jgi:DNA-binding NtrC family response regulator
MGEAERREARRDEFAGVPASLSAATVDFARRAARNDEPVLLLGETGSGKSHLAAVIHRLSARAAGPFYNVNCGSIPDTLFEREMFGHVRGAFTDARESREGAFEAADGGTLFLDEVGELPLTAQTKLLSVLEERRVRRLGATHDTPVDVRVVTATNADLVAMVSRKRFREDLFHRIAVLRFLVPPLRERWRELPGLVQHLLERRGAGGVAPVVTPEAMELIRAYPWPGNVRELDNALRRAVVYAEQEPIAPQHLPEELRAAVPPMAAEGVAPERYVAPDDPEVERRLIEEALLAEGGNRTRAARRLGMSRSALWNKIHRHRIG